MRWLIKWLVVLLVGGRGATLVLLLILCAVLVALPNIGLVEAGGTIYIRADGSVEGTDKIQRDGNVYTFTDDIYEPLVVERDNIVVYGAGYSIEGQHSGLAQSPEVGIMVDRRGNVTIRDVTIKNFMYGIYINNSFTIRINDSKITENGKAILIAHSSDTNIHGNQIKNNIDIGIYVLESSDSNIKSSLIADNVNDGISFFLSSGNVVNNCEIRDNGVGIRITNSSIYPGMVWNNITSNSIGIHLEAPSIDIDNNNIANNGIGIQIAGSDNLIVRNNFIDNTKQVYDIAWNNPEMSPSVNTWYSGGTGNYWSDYNGTGPYVIDENNQDSFPAIEPIRLENVPFDIDIYEDFTISDILMATTIFVIAVVLLLYFRRKEKQEKIKK